MYLSTYLCIIYHRKLFSIPYLMNKLSTGSMCHELIVKISHPLGLYNILDHFKLTTAIHHSIDPSNLLSGLNRCETSKCLLISFQWTPATSSRTYRASQLTPVITLTMSSLRRAMTATYVPFYNHGCWKILLAS